MSDTPMQATSREELERRLMNTTVAKSELEWYASRRIFDLEAALATMTTERDAALKDAERWRWWQVNRAITTITTFFGNGCVNKTIEMAVAEIDSAIISSKEKK